MSRRHEGHVKAYTRDGEFFTLPREQYDALVAAWTGGKTFYHGVGLFGQPLVIKLGEVQGVADWTPEAVASSDEDEKAERAEGLLEGG